MPSSPKPPSIADRDAEIAALQSAFDEYIASSRELEDELDAELARMQDRLAESQNANNILVSQLELLNSQYSMIERANVDLKSKLEAEFKRRRNAELSQEDAENKAREIQGSLDTLLSECDSLHEQLAFKEDEVEEMKIDLAAENERHKAEIEDLKIQLAESLSKTVVHESLASMEQMNAEDCKNQAPILSPLSATSRNTIDTTEGIAGDHEKDEYTLRLEAELEDVTEQLIEAEASLSELEGKLGTASKTQLALEKTIIDLTGQIKELEEECKKNETLRLTALEKQSYQEKIDYLTDKLNLSEREIEVAKEEAMKSSNAVTALQQQLTDETDVLRKELLVYQSSDRTSKMHIESLEKALVDANTIVTDLREEVQNLIEALKNAKDDRSKVIDENESLKKAYDELKYEGENAVRRKEDELVIKYEATIKDLTLRVQRQQSSEEKLDDSPINNDNKNIQELTELRAELFQVKCKLAEFEAAEKATAFNADTNDTPKRKVSEATMLTTPNFMSITDDNNTWNNITDGQGSLKSLWSRSLRSRHSRSRARSSSPTVLEQLESSAVVSASRVAKLKEQYDSLQRQKRMSDVRVKHLEEDMSKLHQQLLSSDSTDQAPKVWSLPSQSVDNRDESRDDYVESFRQLGDQNAMLSELKSLAKKVASQREHNAQLLSKVLKLQTNIQVCCRIRPMMASEVRAGLNRVIESLSETEVGCFDSRTNSWKSFAFDKVWGPDTHQQGVFVDVEPLALSVVEGYNACIFAYGQTGSGKTYTMEGLGNENDVGISFRTIQKLFNLLEYKASKHNLQNSGTRMTNPNENETMRAGDKSMSEFVYAIKVSVLEVYNDEVFDLLSSLEIKRGKNGAIEVPGLTKVDVKSLEDLMPILQNAHDNRATAQTNINERSSRSHMVLNAEVTTGYGDDDTITGNLFLVDLAGSERVAKSEVDGQELKEAGHINKSLSALGNVMEALDRKASYVPYRDSKLTYLLQDSLGGNSRTMMVVTVCPTSYTYDETVFALNFAQRVRRINLGSAQRNVQQKNLAETIKQMSAEMKLLAKAKDISEEQLEALKRDNARIQERLRASSVSTEKIAEESKTINFLNNSHAEITTRWQKEKQRVEEIMNELEKTQNELKLLQQNLNKIQREKEQLSSLLKDKEKENERMETHLRKAKNATSAATLRARTVQIRQSTPLQNVDPTEVKSKVLAILQEHDPQKVGKIDTIMERFKGRESYLLEKMMERYDTSNAVNTTVSKPQKTIQHGETSSHDDSSSIKSKSDASKRSELALARHLQRMKVRT